MRDFDDEESAAWAAAYAAELNRLQYEEEMKASQLIQSKYLRKEDVQPAKLLTIQSLQLEELVNDDGTREQKYVMYFRELPKGLIMNPTNVQLCTQALGDDETDHWVGRQIVLFNDPTVSMKGRFVGGVRIRAPRIAQPLSQGLPPRTLFPPPSPPPQSPQVASEPDPWPTAEGDPGVPFNDDVPF